MTVLVFVSHDFELGRTLLAGGVDRQSRTGLIFIILTIFVICLFAIFMALGDSFFAVFYSLFTTFSAPMLLVGRQEGYPACNSLPQQYSQKFSFWDLPDPE